MLGEDPRPSYQSDPNRRYGMPFAGFDVRFCVEGDTLLVLDVAPYRADEIPPPPNPRDTVP